MNIVDDFLWRVVRLEVGKTGWISWLHEREWRVRDDFELPSNPIAALVHTPKEVMRLLKILLGNPKAFSAKPQCILPFRVICQGLIYTHEQQARKAAAAVNL
jgi:hypothetical protein